MARDRLNLDVDAPHKVSDVLHSAAFVYLDSASELDSAWQNTSAGRPWRMIAKVLASAAVKIDKGMKKMRY